MFYFYGRCLVSLSRLGPRFCLCLSFSRRVSAYRARCIIIICNQKIVLFNLHHYIADALIRSMTSMQNEAAGGLQCCGGFYTGVITQGWSLGIFLVPSISFVDRFIVLVCLMQHNSKHNSDKFTKCSPPVGCDGDATTFGLLLDLKLLLDLYLQDSRSSRTFYSLGYVWKVLTLMAVALDLLFERPNF